MGGNFDDVLDNKEYEGGLIALLQSEIDFINILLFRCIKKYNLYRRGIGRGISV
jgi:hypothetical protein